MGLDLISSSPSDFQKAQMNSGTGGGMWSQWNLWLGEFFPVNSAASAIVSPATQDLQPPIAISQTLPYYFNSSCILATFVALYFMLRFFSLHLILPRSLLSNVRVPNSSYIRYLLFLNNFLSIRHQEKGFTMHILNSSTVWGKILCIPTRFGDYIFASS